MMRRRWHTGCLVVALGASIWGCGGGGGGGGGSGGATILSGTVQAPGDLIAGGTAAPLLRRASWWMMRPAWAGLTGLLPVPDGTRVELVRLSEAGDPVGVLASTTTSAGRYRFDLTALGVEYSSRLAVRAMEGAVQMRAFAVRSTVAVDPVSEAGFRSVLETLAGMPGASLSGLTVRELGKLVDALDVLTGARGMATGVDVESSARAALAALRGNASLQAFLEEAAKAGETTRGPGDVADLRPLEPGSVWNYRVVVTENGAESLRFLTAQQVTGTRDFDGATATVVTESNPHDSGRPVEEYLSKDDLGITNWGNDDPEDIITREIAPYLAFPFPLPRGTSQTVVDASGLTWREDLDGDGRDEWFSVRASVASQGFEPVTLDVGAFPSALRIDVRTDVVVALSKLGGTVTVTDRSTYWQVSGVGTVKRRSVVRGSGAAGAYEESETAEIVGYRVGDAKRGVLARVELAAGLAAQSSDQGRPGPAAVASDGDGFLVVTCRESGSPSGLLALPVSKDGEPSTPVPIAPHDCSFPRPAATAGAGGYLVAFGRDGTIFAVLLSPDGAVAGGAEFAVSTGADAGQTNRLPAVGFDGTNYLVVWQKYSDTDYDVYGARVTPGGDVLDEFAILAGPGDQGAPALAFDGENYLVLCDDTPAGSGPSARTDVSAARVSPEGVVLTPSPLSIAAADGYQGTASAAFDGSNYLVVWIDVPELGTDPPVASIRGRRVSPSGTLLDGAAGSRGLAINTAELGKRDPVVAFDGTNHMVAWAVGAYANAPPAGIHLARVSPAGALLGGAPATAGFFAAGPSSAGSRLIYPRLAADGDGSLLVWLDNERKELEGLRIYPF
ncbi:MAG: hypothetical protein Kow0092_23660 [Deferrisomatales bacterium]